MLLASIGVRQNRMNTGRRMRPRIPMISPLVSRRRRLERRRIRLLAMLAVIPTTPPPPPRMDLHIRVTRPHPLLPGPSQRTHTRPPTNNPVEGNTPPRLATLLTPRRVQIPTDDKRHLPHPNTLLQVHRQPPQATTLLRMVVNIRYRNSPSRRAINPRAPLGTVPDREPINLTKTSLFLRRCIEPRDTLSFPVWMELWSLATLIL
jgi:hypothetical protein